MCFNVMNLFDWTLLLIVLRMTFFVKGLSFISLDFVDCYLHCTILSFNYQFIHLKFSGKVLRRQMLWLFVISDFGLISTNFISDVILFSFLVAL